MARKAGGADQLASARELLRTAKTAEELRTAQAVLLPLELGLSLAQTAKVIGRSIGVTCTLRTRYGKVARHEREAPRPKRALRNRANATLEHEAQILDEVLQGAMRGGIVVIPPLKEKVEERLGKSVALSTIYRMLARNGWRKLAPDTVHPQGNPAAREDWKKTPRQAGRNRNFLGQRSAAMPHVSGRSALRAHQRYAILLVSPPRQAAGLRQGNAAIHLRLWCRQSSRWSLRQPGVAARQFRVYADIL
jgi:transposase